MVFERFLDVTCPITNGMEVYPGDPEVIIKAHTQIGEVGYAVSKLELGTHTGTHVDYPGHVYRDTFLRPGFDALIGPCIVLSIASLKSQIANEDFRPTRLIVKDGLPDIAECATLLGRGLRLIGTGRQSIEEDGCLNVHRLILGRGAAILEQLCLSEAPEGPSFLIALPLLTEADDGAPIRVVLAY